MFLPCPVHRSNEAKAREQDATRWRARSFRRVFTKRPICRSVPLYVIDLMARPEKFELPPPWFVVFHLGSRIFLLRQQNFENDCPVKFAYLALFRTVW